MMAAMNPEAIRAAQAAMARAEADLALARSKQRRDAELRDEAAELLQSLDGMQGLHFAATLS